MSTFRVKLNNNYIGNLDPTVLGAEAGSSTKRTMYVTGPRGIRRQLKDGETFIDCNYWKQFAFPQVSEMDAFIEVLSDDGSVYSTVREENNHPRVYTLSIADDSSYQDNVVDIYGDTGGSASFVQINNFATGGSVKVKINGISNAIFDLEQGSIQQFNNGDISINKLEFHNESGTNATVQIILSVLSIPKS